MAANLYYDSVFSKMFPAYALAYSTIDDHTQVFVPRKTGGWRFHPTRGLAPLVLTTSADPNFLLFNPAAYDATLTKNMMVEITFSTAGTDDQIGVIARGNNDTSFGAAGTNGLFCCANGLTVQNGIFYNGGGINYAAQTTTNYTRTINTVYRLRVYVRTTSAGHTVIKGQLALDSAPNTALTAPANRDETNAENQTAGTFGVFSLTYNAGTGISRIRAWTVDGTFTAWAKATSSSAGVALEATPIDGTGPFTYQWSKCATCSGTYANITGATTDLYTYTGGTVGATEFYQCVITDTGNANATSTSNSVTGCRQESAIAIGFAGDSHFGRNLDAGVSSNDTMGVLPDLLAHYLSAQLNRTVTVVNGAVSGITAATFTSTYQTAWLAACATAGATFAVIGFGGNYTSASDAATVLSVATTATSDISAVCSAAVAGGMTAVLMDAQLIQSYGRSGRNSWVVDTIRQINANLSALVNDTTIVEGDLTLNDFIASNADACVDQLHFDVWAQHIAASRLSKVLADLIDPPEASSSTIDNVLKVLQAQSRPRTR